MKVVARLVRRHYERELERIDAEVAHWFVNDGTLSTWPLEAPSEAAAAEDTHRVELRRRRLRAVARLRRWGGSDPWNSVLDLPTVMQREWWDSRYRDSSERLEQIANLAEAALLGTEPRRAIWEDSDYLVAVLAMASDSDRARIAAITHGERMEDATP